MLFELIKYIFQKRIKEQSIREIHAPFIRIFLDKFLHECYHFGFLATIVGAAFHAR